MTFKLRKLDSNPIPSSKGEVRAFACIRNETLRLPFLLDYHRRLGVRSFFFIDNMSDDGTAEYLVTQKDCHTFHCSGNFFAENVDPPSWTNALRKVFGEGHWCLSLDADEMFVYPHCETVPLGTLCTYLDESGATAMTASVIDMYGDTAILDATYQKGQSFVEACPYFDPELGYMADANGSYPSVQMYSKFRERAFWDGQFRKQRLPCITQVPLVKWSKGMNYLVAQHLVNYARLSDMQGVILHFKFLPGFIEGIINSIQENGGVAEKGLKERSTYVDTLARNPNLNLRNEKSVRYRDSRQLVDMNWLKTSHGYEQMAAGAQQISPDGRQSSFAGARKISPRSGYFGQLIEERTRAP